MDLRYDISKIGKQIALGGDRRVFAYGDREIIKISRLSPFIGSSMRSKLVHDYTVCRRYFPRFVVETQDVTPEGSPAYTEIQPRIDGEPLCVRHMRNPKVRAQLEEILAGMARMERDGYAQLDLIGNGGVLRPCLSNVLVDRNHDLKIIDTTLYEVKSLAFGFSRILRVLLPLAKMRQRYLIRKLLA